MRTLSAAMNAIIASGNFTQDVKAQSRVTIQKIQLGIYNGADGQVYSSIPFLTTASQAHELPNLKSVKWDRSTGSDVSECVLELFNTAALPPGTGPAQDGSFDLLGFYSYNRGRTSYSQADWGHSPNEWQDYLVPDRVIRLYQGYGANYALPPENDDKQILMGVYLIDEVLYTADGLITVTCRDVGRLLTDDICFPPVVPLSKYPLKFSTYRTVSDPPQYTSTSGWTRPAYDTDSGRVYVGSASVFGHYGQDAVDADEGTYWLSTGNARPSQGYSFEYVQGQMAATTISAVRARVWGGSYRVYLSVRVGGAWLGAAIIPYDPSNPASAPNGSNIPYLQVLTVGYEGVVTFNLGSIVGVTAIRVTFTDLFNSGLGSFPYRAGVRTLEFATTITTVAAGGTHVEGSYGDYTEIVKRLLAYGGFYWPQDGRQYLTDGNEVVYSFGGPDPYVMPGRVWGDIQMSGVAGKIGVDLGVDIWDKRPLLDGINYVKDILGFIFYVNEQGAAVFRSPNIFRLGNWVSDTAGVSTVRSLSYVTLNDSQSIISLRATLSSRNLREKVFIATTSGRVGAVSNGRIPYPSGLRRVGGWSDQRFESAAECQIMADLITLRQLFSFRQDALRIPANPAIQCDDQIKIVERTTGEDYFHHVTGISSQWDVETGQWTYDLTTSWLGTSPVAEWAFSSTGLASETQDFLRALGQI